MTDFSKYINKCWIWLLRISPLLSCIIWYILTERNTHGRIGLYICSISSFIYFTGVLLKHKSKKFSISEGALLLVMIQLSIIAFVIIDYFDITILFVNLRAIVVSLVLIFLLVAIFRAFVIIPKYSDDVCNYAPNVDISELTSESRNILSTLGNIDIQEKKTVVYSCIYLLKDYMYIVNKTPKTCHPRELLSKYMPTQHQIINHPFESLSLLLSAQNYIEANYTEDQYCNFQTNLQIIDEQLSKYQQ